MEPQPANIAPNKFAVGAYGILGMDIVSFLTLDEETQTMVIQRLMRYLKESVLFHSLTEADFRWSPAADGGYLTFVNPKAGRAAIDVAFSIFEKVRASEKRISHERLRIRAALHAGYVRENADLSRETNIWGMGINTTARILSVSVEDQILVSQQYYDTYIKDQREGEFNFGEPYWRTVRHGVLVDVMNASKPGLCLDRDDASAKGWRYLGGLWRKTAQEYEFLMADAMRSGEAVAAIAAARYLLKMGEEAEARRFCKTLSDHETTIKADFPVPRHPLFSAMPADVLFDVLGSITPRVVRANEVICEDGAAAESCFFPVSGKIVLDIPGRDAPSSVKKGRILGEFSLWIPNLKRTARIRSLDAGLVLELGHRPLAAMLARHPDVATVIYSLIQRRIVENVFLSPALFPGLESEVDENLSRFGAVCVKVPGGDALDIATNAFVILIGKVRIQCATGAIVEIGAEGRFDQLPVAGICSAIGKPDGGVAEVLEDTVAVRISHDVLVELQRAYPVIQRVWSGLCGARLQEARWHL